ncbi:DNA-binding response regulator, NarL/FixJ family, contains REC and HTH domains [Tindallia magadiensis]|uniref:Stage 0 sporulation protein A homolog n=1 Tax=Tindallia magadiensis TaxID=69895 RepID=A0A1I3D8P1_9FIRM|nr:response regulator transcription factor [Tindallia magadiensis]SFH83036.1 DNA-binding response regulator, NarL/FixJ family, contains REC and HTH domains [Tindallia magadiensis]
MIRLLLADDQVLFRSMLEEVIASDERFQLVGCASNGLEALDLIKANQPDVALLDIRMPKMDGLATLATIKERYPAVKVLMFTTFEDPFSVRESLQAGADGYLLKSMKPPALLAALFCVAQDIMVMHREIYESTLKNNTPSLANHSPTLEIDGIQFTKSDLQIMKGIAEGKTNKEIALLLNYSEGTIKNKVSQLLSKTNLQDRTQISVYALKNQLI